MGLQVFRFASSHAAPHLQTLLPLLMPAIPVVQLTCKNHPELHNATLWIPTHHIIYIQALKRMRNLPEQGEVELTYSTCRDACMFSYFS